MTDQNKMRLRWSIGALCVAGAIGAAVVFIVFMGGFDVAADAAWSQPSTWAIHRTMIHSVQARSGEARPPDRFTVAEVREGFRLYDAHCAMCHGGPGLGREPWTAGLEPSPPYLIDAAHRWSRQDLYWIIRHGVKMTGMPGWKARISSPETWNLVAFLEALPYLTADDYARMRAALPQGGRLTTQPADFGPQPPPTP